MNQTSVLITGANGLVGSKFKQLYETKYQFDSLEISHPTQPIDITNLAQVQQAFATSTAEVVVHLAAYTDVTKAWEQRHDKTGLAYQVNVVGTQNIIQAAAENNKHLIHISTAYVFDGKKDGLYVETDPINPIEWYGQTKAWAEEAVQASSISWTILRIDQPFRSDPFPKLDLVHRIATGLKNNNLYPMFTDHFFGPTFLNDFSRVLDWSISQKPEGVFHATSGEKWSDYDLAQLIKEIHQLPGEVKPGQLSTYLETLNRPYQANTALNATKLTSQINFPLHSIKAAVELVEI